MLNVANRWKRGKLIQFKHQEWKGKKYKEICFMVEKCYSKVTTHTRFNLGMCLYAHGMIH